MDKPAKQQEFDILAINMYILGNNVYGSNSQQTARWQVSLFLFINTPRVIVSLVIVAPT